MSNESIEKIKKFSKDKALIHKTFKDSKVYNSFLNLMQATYVDGNLKKVYKELIAIGVSLAINCEPCVEFHINEALKSGATKEQILEAIEVAFEMGGGPIVIKCSFALEVLEHCLSQG